MFSLANFVQAMAFATTSKPFRRDRADYVIACALMGSLISLVYFCGFRTSMGGCPLIYSKPIRSPNISFRFELRASKSPKIIRFHRLWLLTNLLSIHLPNKTKKQFECFLAIIIYSCSSRTCLPARNGHQLSKA